MIHDWFSHGTSPKEDPWVVPLGRRRLARAADEVLRTPPDPTAPADRRCRRRTSTSMTHWWDASQIYGNDLQQQRFLRAHAAAGCGWPTGCRRSRPTRRDEPGAGARLLARPGHAADAVRAGAQRIADMLAAATPIRRRALFQQARLVNCALLAKIHTVEWTPRSPPIRPLSRRCAPTGGAGRERCTTSSGGSATTRSSRGIPGTRPSDYGVPYALTEEFVAVYRMHPLMPDDSTSARPATMRRRSGRGRSASDRTAGRADPADSALDDMHLHVRHHAPGRGHTAQLSGACRLQAARNGA